MHTFDGILALYAQITPHVALSGPTSFAPAILSAIDTVIRNDGAYHIALIIADGQVSEHCMRDTIDAIVLASHYPLSIVIIGVGDGACRPTPAPFTRFSSVYLFIYYFILFYFIYATTTCRSSCFQSPPLKGQAG